MIKESSEYCMKVAPLKVAFTVLYQRSKVEFEDLLRVQKRLDLSFFCFCDQGRGNR